MHLFATALELSLVFAPVLLLLLLLAPKLSRRYAPAARCLLWAAIAVRLLLPVGFTGARPITILLPGEAPVLTERLPAAEISKEQGPTPELPAGDRDSAAPANLFARHWRDAISLLWLGGALLFLGYHMTAHIFICRRLKRWSLPIADPAVEEALSRAKERAGVFRPVALRRSNREGPLLLGFLRPCVILPRQSLHDDALEDILCHELTHLRHGHLWYKLLMLLCCSVYWFHPLVHWMSRQLNADLEAFCDAEVIDGKNEKDRSAYGLTVLSQMEETPVKTLLTTGLGGSRKRLLRRFEEIKTPSAGKRTLPLLLCAAILLCGLLVGCDTASLQETAPEPSLPDTSGAGADDGGQDWLWPTDGGKINIGLNGYAGHTGADIAVDEGTAVYAAKPGRVVQSVESNTGYGNYLVIQHDEEWTSLYAHCSKLLVEEGDEVAQGQDIAEAGQSGNTTRANLHFEIRCDSKPVDPKLYIGSAASESLP